MDLKEQIAERIRERYGSVPNLARALNMSDQTIYSSIKGHLVGSSMTTAMPIVLALNLDPVQLLEGRLESSDPEENGYLNVPVFERITASQPLAPNHKMPHFPVPLDVGQRNPGCFLLRVREDGVSRILPKGSYALVRPTSQVERDNMPYALCIGDEDALVRRVRLLQDGYQLVPDSMDPTYRPQVIDFADPACPNVRILGQVAWYALPPNWEFPQA